MRPIDAYIRGDVRAEARVLGYERREPLWGGTRRLPGPFVICRLRREVRWVQTSSLGAGPWDPETVEAPHGQPCPLFSLLDRPPPGTPASCPYSAPDARPGSCRAGTAGTEGDTEKRGVRGHTGL